MQNISIIKQEKLDRFIPPNNFNDYKNNVSVWDKLELIDWDFKNSQTQYLTHKYHSYPAKKRAITTRIWKEY